jgi:hypothetical protein
VFAQRAPPPPHPSCARNNIQRLGIGDVSRQAVTIRSKRPRRHRLAADPLLLSSSSNVIPGPFVSYLLSAHNTPAPSMYIESRDQNFITEQADQRKSQPPPPHRFIGQVLESRMDGGVSPKRNLSAVCAKELPQMFSRFLFSYFIIRLRLSADSQNFAPVSIY